MGENSDEECRRIKNKKHYMCERESRTQMQSKTKRNVSSSVYCPLKPSGLCYALVQLKRRFAVEVVSVTRPSPNLRI